MIKAITEGATTHGVLLLCFTAPLPSRRFCNLTDNYPLLLPQHLYTPPNCGTVMYLA